MPIARAFTKRLGRSDSNAAELSRADSIRKISSPIALLSTTNMISYEAPDVSVARLAMSHAANAANSPDYSRKSSESDHTSPSTPSAPSLTDGSSLENSPTIEYNHLTCYFPGSAKGGPNANNISIVDAPVVPRRAPSHSKHEHERLARKRSITRSARASREPSPSPRSPVQITTPATFEVAGIEAPSGTEAASTPSTTQFGGRDYQHMNDIAEDTPTVSVIDPEFVEDEKYMKRRGLCVYTAADYTNIIGSLWPAHVFETGLPNRDNTSAWI